MFAFLKKQTLILKKNKNTFNTYLNRGFSIKGQGYGNGLQKFTDMPFQYLIVYEINKVIPRFLFTENHYPLTDNLSIYKRIYEWPAKVKWMNVPRVFETYSIQINLTKNQTDDVRNFNNYKNQVKNAKLNDLIEAAEYAYFLYENQNIIKETFISEIDKKVNLIGNISYFGTTESDGRMRLINNKNKLNFN